MAKVTADDVLDSIEQWSVLDLNKLVKGIEEKFGVSATAMMPAMAVGQGGASVAAAAPTEEKTEFSVILASVGEKKIQVIFRKPDFNPTSRGGRGNFFRGRGRGRSAHRQFPGSGDSGFGGARPGCQRQHAPKRRSRRGSRP